MAQVGSIPTTVLMENEVEELDYGAVFERGDLFFDTQEPFAGWRPIMNEIYFGKQLVDLNLEFGMRFRYGRKPKKITNWTPVLSYEDFRVLLEAEGQPVSG